MFHCLYNLFSKDTHCVFWFYTKLLFLHFMFWTACVISFKTSI